MPDLRRIPALHDTANAHWHEERHPEPAPESDFDRLVLDQHRANFDLWHEEDQARDAYATDARIAEVKRAIDRINQRRNDLAEQLDLILLRVAPSQSGSETLHSETPGLIIDRLSILSLKLFHTAEQIDRNDVDEAHRSRNRNRFSVLQDQRADLAAALVDLWKQVLAGQRRFKLYQQLKMYNDPTLNPVLYRANQRKP